jgi:hypothetical protein
MATAGSIVIDLLMKTGAFETDTQRAERSMKRLQQTAYKAGEAIGSTFRGAGILMATGLAAGGAAAVSWTRDVIQLGNEIDKLSKLAGTSSTVFQGLAAGANTVGISQEKLADIYKDTQDKVGDFLQTGGGPLQDFFNNIAPKVGVTADQFRKLSGPEALGAYFDALVKAGVSQNELIFFMEAIASDSSMLIPLLKDNSAGFRDWATEAERLGAVIGNDTTAKMKELREESARIELAFQGLKVEVAEQLLPAMGNLVEIIGSESTGKAFGTMIGWVGSLTAEMVKSTTIVVNWIDRMMELRDLNQGGALSGASNDALSERMADIQQLINAEKRNTSGFLGLPLTDGQEEARQKRILDLETKRRDIQREMTKRIRDDNKAAYDQMKANTLATGSNPAPGTFRTKVVDEDAKKAAEQLANSYKSANDQLERQIALYGVSSELAEVNYEIQNGGLKGLDANLQSVIRANASLLDIMEAMSEVDAYQQEDADKFAAAFEGMFGGDEGTEEIKKQLDGISLYADQAARNMQDSFADFLFDPFAEGLGGMVKGFAESIQRMLAEAGSSQFFELLGSWATSYSGSGSGWINAIGGALSGGRAGGGSVAGSGMYRVGEGNRPELLHQGGKSYLLPGEAGRIEPITVGRSYDNSGGGAAQINVVTNVTVSDSGTQSQSNGSNDAGARQLSNMMKSAVVEVMQQQMRPGGMFAPGRGMNA